MQLQQTTDLTCCAHRVARALSMTARGPLRWVACYMLQRDGYYMLQRDACYMLQRVACYMLQRVACCVGLHAAQVDRARSRRHPSARCIQRRQRRHGTDPQQVTRGNQRSGVVVLALVGAAGCCTLCDGVWYGAVCPACSSACPAASCAGGLRADAQQHGLRCPLGFVHRTTMDEVTMSAWPRSLGCRTLSCAVPHMGWVRTRKALNHADRRKWACRKTRGSLRCTAS